MKKIPIYDKPSYVGFCILELSKYKMYDTFYNGIKKKWPSSCLSYMDTDSFIVNIPIPRNKFSYEGVEEYFDLSVYGEGHEWYSNANKGVLGKLKDEYPKDYIKEFVAIRSKLYGLTCNSGKFVVKCKGNPNWCQSFLFGGYRFFLPKQRTLFVANLVLLYYRTYNTAKYFV